MNFKENVHEVHHSGQARLHLRKAASGSLSLDTENSEIDHFFAHFPTILEKYR